MRCGELHLASPQRFDLCSVSIATRKITTSAPIIPPHSPSPVPVLTVSGAAGAKANSCSNVALDISEKTDLAAKESQRVTQMRDELHAWQKQVGAKSPIPNPAYDATKPNGRAANRPAQSPKKP